MGYAAYQIGGNGFFTGQPSPVISPRNPLPSDTISPNGGPYPIGQKWNNTTTMTEWEYWGGGIWTESNAETGAVLSLSDSSSVKSFPDGTGNIQIAGGAGVTTVTTANTITISGSGAGFSWSSVAGGSTTTMQPEHAYLVTGGAGTAILNLPTTTALYDTYIVQGTNVMWRIQASGSQVIHVGSTASTAGGSFSSSAVGDTVELVCATPSLVFYSRDVSGNLTEA